MATGPHVLITGCSPGGIGNALAREFYARNCRVIATARRDVDLDELRTLGMRTVVLDVTDQDSIDKAVKAVREITGSRLDILVNNAGARYVMPLADSTLSKVRNLFETNVYGPMALTNALLPSLIAARGLVVNISSASDRLPFPFKGAYGMTKAALTSYSRTLSVELAPFDVRVLNIVTAFVESRGGKTASADDWPESSLYNGIKERALAGSKGKRMSAEDYAKQVVDAALRGRGWQIWGWTVFGGTRDQIRLGSKSMLTWVLSLMPPEWSNLVIGYQYGFHILKRALRREKQA